MPETEGEWFSLDSELLLRDGQIIGTRKPTGHALFVHTYFDAAAEAPEAAGEQLDVEPAIGAAVAADDLDGDDADAEPPLNAQQVRALYMYSSLPIDLR